MNINQLKKLKKKLPKGGVLKISNRTGMSISMVSYVLTGKRYNKDVIQAAINIIEETSKEEELLNQKINSL